MSIEELFVNSLSADNGIRQSAQDQILALELNPSTTASIFEFLGNSSTGVHGRQAAALLIKTQLAKIYDMFDNSLSIKTEGQSTMADQSKVTPDAINYIKESVIPGILSTEEEISSVLRDITELIARDSFNENWSTLMETLAATVKGDDPMTTYRIFRTVSPILKKIRFMSRSDTLYT